MKISVLAVTIILGLFGPLKLIWAEVDHNVDLIDDTNKDMGNPMSPTQIEEAKRIGKSLDALFVKCGRYPTTQEGLKALVSQPKTYDCKSWGVETKKGIKAYLATVPKGWKYVSEDGRSYNIEPLKRRP